MSPPNWLRFRIARVGEKVVARIQFVVADKLKNSSVKSVRSRLRRCIEERSAAVVLRGVGALLHAELLQRIDRRLDKRSALVLLAHIHTIQQKRDRASANTADRVSIHDFGPDRQRVSGRRQQRCPGVSSASGRSRVHSAAGSVSCWFVTTVPSVAVSVLSSGTSAYT